MHKHINKDFLKIDTLMEVLACVCVLACALAKRLHADKWFMDRKHFKWL